MLTRERNSQGFDLLTISTDEMQVILMPEVGGKISSVKNLITGREWLWKNPHLPLRHPEYGGSYVREYDTGGWDECFPTVDACHHPSHPWTGVLIPDHGELYSQSWSVDDCSEDANGASVTLSVMGVRFPYRFRRTLHVPSEGACFKLSYRVENLSGFDMPFLWCCHPLIAVEPGMRLCFPSDSQARFGFSVDDWPGCAGDSFEWPLVAGNPVDLVPDPSSSEFLPMGTKIFVGPLTEGWSGITSPDERESLEFRFDLREISHVALWLNYKKWSGAGTDPYFNVAFEPCIGPSDALDAAVRYHHSQAVLPAQGVKDWQLSVNLRTLEEPKI